MSFMAILAATRGEAFPNVSSLTEMRARPSVIVWKMWLMSDVNENIKTFQLSIDSYH